MRVLCGVDGTESSLRALDRAAERAAEVGDELTVAIVGEVDADEIEQQVETTLDRTGLDADVRHRSGDPGSELVELADTDEFDRLIVGGGERSPMGKIDVSHDVQFVLLNAQTSVTLIR